MHPPSRQNTTSSGLFGGYKALFATPHRFSFNGKESDSEVKGEGNNLDFGARMYDSRLGRFLSRDPKESKYVSWSTYTAFLDNPIIITDPTGKGGEISITYDKVGKPIGMTITSVIYVYSEIPEVQNNIQNHAAEIQKNINDTWNRVDKSGNSNNFTVNYKGENIPVTFNVSVIPCKSPEEAKEQLRKHLRDPKYNYIHLNTTSISEGNNNYYCRTTDNVGSWTIFPQNSFTYAHEYGHLLANRLYEDKKRSGDPEPNGLYDHTDFSPSIFHSSGETPQQNDFNSINFGFGITGGGQKIGSLYALKEEFKNGKKNIGEVNADKVFSNFQNAASFIENRIYSEKAKLDAIQR